MLSLTEENYYTPEANQAYFSVSQYKGFLQCPAMEMAKVRGEYEPPLTSAMRVGQYVDHYFEGTLPRYKEEHPEIFTNRKLLRAEFRTAEDIIKVVKTNEKFMRYMSGEKQKILTFEMFGAPWKMKMDSFLEDVCITDLKIVANEEKMTRFQYEIQGAVYQYGAEYNGYGHLPFYLAVAEKRKLINAKKPKEVTYLNQPEQIPDSILEEALLKIEINMPEFIAIKNGLQDPRRCEKCDWCKMTRTGVRNYRDLLEG